MVDEKHLTWYWIVIVVHQNSNVSSNQLHFRVKLVCTAIQISSIRTLQRRIVSSDPVWPVDQCVGLPVVWVEFRFVLGAIGRTPDIDVSDELKDVDEMSSLRRLRFLILQACLSESKVGFCLIVGSTSVLILWK